MGTVESGCFQFDVTRDTSEMSTATYLPPNINAISFPMKLVESSDEISRKYNSSLYNTFENVEVKENPGVGSTFFDLIQGHSDLHLNFAPDYFGWDICGPSALLMSRIGYCADSKGKQL